ncbi:MAG: hypothetical protein ACK4RZ_09745 [Paracoccaceae bacterium]
MISDAPMNDPTALTTFFETRFHQIHRAQLPDLAALALRVERVHGDNPDAPHGLGGFSPMQVLSSLGEHFSRPPCAALKPL